jgi:hypothetical protein
MQMKKEKENKFVYFNDFPKIFGEMRYIVWV